MEALIRAFFAQMGTQAHLEADGKRKAVQAISLPVSGTSKPEFSVLGQIPQSSCTCYLPGNAGAQAGAVLRFGDRAYRIDRVDAICAGGESPLYIRCSCAAMEDSL